MRGHQRASDRHPEKPLVIHHARMDGDALSTRILHCGAIRLGPPGMDLLVEDFDLPSNWQHRRSERSMMSGSSRSSAGLDARRRRALFRAWRRGTREADLLLGRFADAYMERLAERDLAAFERLMEAPDGDLVDWVAGCAPVPPEHQTPLFETLVRFHRKHEQI